jgi:polysaccharide export outer membrane protein
MLTSLKNVGCTALRPSVPQLQRLRTLSALILVLHLVGVSAVATGQTTENAGKVTLPQFGEASSNAVLLSPGDMLDVEVFDTPELSGKLRVAHDGTIAMPVAGPIKVAGLTPGEADAAIERRLRDTQIMLSPSVTVLVTDYATQGIDVLGEVKSPGIYRFLGSHSLYDALAAAGGVTPTEGSTVTITHRDDPMHPLIVQVHSADYSTKERLTEVGPGDVVDVSRAESIYVIGDVNHAGQFPLAFGRPMNVLDAVALAQGVTKTAKLTKASIVRKTSDGGAQTIPIDLQAIQKNKAADPSLQADDVLVIPRSGAKAFLDTAIPGATGAVVGAIAYGFIRN